jgi:hypothetical protein
MAKRYAADSAHQVIDRAVQIFGGLGVSKASKVEELYREIRALRIYEGASEVQKLVIARQVLADWAASRSALMSATKVHLLGLDPSTHGSSRQARGRQDETCCKEPRAVT